MTRFAHWTGHRALLLGLLSSCSSNFDLVPVTEVGSAQGSGGSGAGRATDTSIVAAAGARASEAPPPDLPLQPAGPNAGPLPGGPMPTPDLPPAACPDADGDARCDADDRCPLVAHQDDALDSDNDGRPDACDNCDGVAATLAMGPLYYFSFDEAPGSTEAVSRGTVPFSATYVADVQLGVAGVADGRGTALHLPGNASFPRVQAINVPVFPTRALTATAWVRTRQPGLYTILSYATGDSFNEFGVYINGTGTRVGLESLNFDQELNAQRVTDGTWHFVAVTWVGDTLQVYFDGEVAGPPLRTAFATANQTLFPLDPGETIDISAGGTLIFGQDQDQLNGGFALEQSLNGGLDEVALFDRALSADEVRQVFTATTCGERCDRIDNDGDGLVDEGFLGGSPACLAPSCQAIQESGSAFVSGSYFLQGDPNLAVTCSFR